MFAFDLINAAALGFQIFKSSSDGIPSAVLVGLASYDIKGGGELDYTHGQQSLKSQTSERRKSLYLALFSQDNKRAPEQALLPFPHLRQRDCIEDEAQTSL